MTKLRLLPPRIRRALVQPCMWAALVVACGDDVGRAGDVVDADAGSYDAVAADTGAAADAADAADAVIEEPDWCDGATTHLYDPLVREELDLWPDAIWTRADSDSPTGMRLDVTAARWLPLAPDLLRPAFEDLAELSGFGRNGGAVLRFDAPVDPLAVPSGAEASTTSDAIQWWDLESTPPTRVPFEASLGDDDRDIVLWPLRPLRSGTEHAIVVTTVFKDAAGQCVAPSDVTRDVLTRRAVGSPLEPLVDPWLDALDTIAVERAAVSAMTTFSTHDDLTVFVDIAARIAARDVGWVDRPTCIEDGDRRECFGLYDSRDYRTAGHVGAATDGEPWAVPVTFWLPRDTDEPVPLVLFGHGLNSTRNHGRLAADRMVPNGWAVVAPDAVSHGLHPSVDPDSVDLSALAFLGIDLNAFTIDALTFRGNFNQTALDRLTLLRLLEQDPDIDGDGTPDVDLDRLAYWGISLGGMLGPTTLALDTRIRAGVLSIAGGRLMTFATDTAAVAPFRPAIVSIIGSEALFERLLPVAATLIDAADPATWAAHMLRDRLVGDPQHLLLPVSSNDEVVPPASGRALARAIGAPHLAPVVLETELLEVVEGPLTGNLPGNITAAYFQLDRVTVDDSVVLSDHDNTPHSAEGDVQIGRFFSTWLAAGIPTIVDPYEELGTPPFDE